MPAGRRRDYYCGLVLLVCLSRWEGIPSVILSTAHFLLHCEAAVRGRLLVPVLEASLPWTMHHHHATRQAALISCMRVLLECFSLLRRDTYAS